jgi:hypothetical protein
MTGEIMSKETNDSGTPGVVRVDRLVRPAKRATRTETVTVRLDPDTLRSAELVATVTCRTVSSLMQYALQLYIAKNYPEAKTPGARVVARIDEAPDERA